MLAFPSVLPEQGRAEMLHVRSSTAPPGSLQARDASYTRVDFAGHARAYVSVYLAIS